MIRTLAAFCALILVTVPVATSADIVGEVAAGLNRFYHGRVCPDATIRERDMLNCNAKPTFFTSLASIVEDRFFSYGAEKQIAQYQCLNQRLTGIVAANSTAPRIYAQDLQAKLPHLRAMYREIESIRAQLRQARPLVSRIGEGKIVPRGNQELYDRITKPLQARYAKLAPLYASMYESIPLKQWPQGEAYVARLIKSTTPASEARVRQILSQQITDNNNEANKIRAKKVGPGVYNLPRPMRERLFTEGDPESWLDPADRGTREAQSLMCRMDQRYGKGVEDLDNTLFVGSMFLGGAGVLMKLGAGAKVISSAITMRNRAAVFSATTEIMIARGSEFATAGFTRQMYADCLSGPRPSAILRNACSKEPDAEVQASLDQGNCALAVGLSAAPQALRIALNSGERASILAFANRLKRVRTTIVNAPNAVTPIERRAALAVVAPEAARARTSADVVSEYLNRVPVTPQQNRAYMEIAENLTPDGKTVFFDSENSLLKPLNDRLRDKNLVTALTNLHKQTLIRELRLLQAKYPKIRAYPYSDFKSIRYAFRGDIPPGFEREVARAFDNANKKFKQEVADLNVIRASDNPDDWFRFGYGDTADRANLAARAARDESVPGLGTTFGSVRTRLATRFTESSALRTGLESNTRLATVMEGEAGRRIPTRETFDLIRKYETPDKLVGALRARYPGSQFEVEDANQLITYAKRVDEYSPGISVAEREVVNLDGAANGGYSVDFLGLGSMNQHATAKALAGASDLEQAVVQARLGEREVTTEFRGRLDAFRTGAGEGKGVRCSGDDCMEAVQAPLSAADRQAVVDRLNRDPQTREVRVAFISSGIRRAGDRTTMSTHGESVEKFLRKRLEGQIPRDRLREITFGIDMRGTQAGSGEIGWLAGVNGPALTEAERGIVNAAMGGAVDDLANDLAKQNIRSTYTFGR